MRIAVISPIPTPYRDGFWNVVARQEGVQLKVYYCAVGKSDRPWKVDWNWEFDGEVLPGWNLARFRGPGASCFWNPGLVRRLRKHRWDAMIIGGYNHPTMWAAMRYAVRQGIPYLLMCETYMEHPKGAFKKWIKQRLVGWVLRNAAGGLPTGVLAERYLRGYGVPADRLWRIPNVPDVDAIASEVNRLRRRRDELRLSRGLDERRVVLFAARLIPKKRPRTLIEAYDQADPDRKWQLVLVGDGEQRPVLEALIRDRQLEDDVKLVGHVQPREMPGWYALADLFVLPSSETWGVVVLEALAAGLPVIVTDEVGCHADLFHGDANGQVVPADDEIALADALCERMKTQCALHGETMSSPDALRSYRYEYLASRLKRTLEIIDQSQRGGVHACA